MATRPCSDDKGHPVTIRAPNTPTPLFSWLDPIQAGTVVPVIAKRLLEDEPLYEPY